MTIPRNNLIGVEFDFLAVDRDGHVALFSTAGYGPVPEAALAVEHEHQLQVVEDLALRALPVIGGALENGRGAGECHEWRELARRGLFVFDWKHRDGPYERVVSPSQAVTSEQIPGRLRPLLNMRFGDCFAQSETVASIEPAAN